MKLLVATRLTQGDRDDDFDHGTVPGEIVEPFSVCDLDMTNDATPCGCGRAFVGMTSGAATTTAIVADLDLNRATLRGTLAAMHPDEDADLVDAMGEQLIEYGAEHPAGTVVGIAVYELQERT